MNERIKPRRYWGVGWAKLTPKVSAIEMLYKCTSKTHKMYKIY